MKEKKSRRKEKTEHVRFLVQEKERYLDGADVLQDKGQTKSLLK